MRRNDAVADYFGVTSPVTVGDVELKPSEIAMIAKKVVSNFTISADDTITDQHVPERYREFAPTLVPLAKKMWADVQSRDGKLWLDQGSGRPHRFHHVSTDEVYGSLGPEDPAFSEATPYAPNSPYSASKAGSDHLVRAYHHTFGLETTTSNCSNNYGPYQYPEKLIPLFLLNCLHNRDLPIYGDGMNVRDCGCTI